MLKYTLYTVLSFGAPTGIGVLFEDRKYSMIDTFLAGDERMFRSEIEERLKSSAGEKVSFTGNVYKITFMGNTVEIEDTLSDQPNCSYSMSLEDFRTVYTDWRNAEDKLRNGEMHHNIVPTANVILNVQKNILDGVKVPHGLSLPVVRYEDGHYYLAVFLFYFNADDIRNQMVQRPSRWALLDIQTGEIVENRACSEIDFSNESFSKTYSIAPNPEGALSKREVQSMFMLLDSVRYELFVSGKVNMPVYKRYLDMITTDTPEEYRVFYRDLSNPCPNNMRRKLSEIEVAAVKLAKQGDTTFHDGTTEEKISEFEKKHNVALPSKVKDWLLFSDGGSFFEPSGLLLYGIEHEPIIDPDCYDIPGNNYVVIGTLGTGEIVLCRKSGEEILVCYQEMGKVEADEIYSDLIAFLNDLKNLLDKDHMQTK